MSRKVHFSKKIYGMGDFTKVYNYTYPIVITEIRVSTYCTSKKYKKGYFTAFITQQYSPYQSSPIYKLKTIKINAIPYKRLCKRYNKKATVCRSEFLQIVGTRLKYMKYTVTIIGYKIIGR